MASYIAGTCRCTKTYPLAVVVDINNVNNPLKQTCQI